MTRARANLVFEIAVFAVVGAGVILSFGWPRATALLPYTFGTLVVVLLGVLILRDIRAELRGAAVAGPEPEEPARLRGAGAQLGVLILYGAAVWLCGFYPATGLYLAFCFRTMAGLRLGAALLWAGLVTAVVAGLFLGVLKLDPYTGLIWAALT